MKVRSLMLKNLQKIHSLNICGMIVLYLAMYVYRRNNNIVKEHDEIQQTESS